MKHGLVLAKTSTTDAWGWPSFPIVVVVIGFAIGLFTPALLNDGDTYWHIATGQWILRTGAIPHADPFSYTVAGAPWVAHEWLSELVMALAWKAAGWNGIMMLFGAATAITFGAFAHYLTRWLRQPAALVVFILGAACISGSLLARPHLLALPVLVLWSAGLLRARDQSTAPSLWLLPLMLVWANLHGSFVFGLALVVPLAIEAWLDAGESRISVVRGWGVFLAAATGVSLVTPNGWHGLLFPFELARMTQIGSISEWRPTDFHALEPMEMALMATLYIAFSRGIRLPMPRLLTLLAVLHLALQHSRHQMLAGLAGALLLTAPLGQAFGAATGSDRPGPFPALRWAVAGVACMLVLTTLRIAHPLVRTDDYVSPATALDHVPPGLLSEPVINSYEFGGYLIFRNVKPFIDGRADMYGDDFMAGYSAAFKPDRAAFERTVDKYGIRWALLGAHSSALPMIDALPGWRRVYADRVAAVYVRD
ncbi:hypothetical protein [Paraburkholderia ginsengiterrae]|uniref:hypothetical protein n=1 Tax=Paraburkholderia ginsengiterrae TaxID=1462993 RepID=UPI000ACEB664|nr:hypothetical protein [Paraburkholderia ginsengiterrae]